MPRYDDHLDELQELVTTRYWKALKAEIAEVQQGLIARLCEPINSLQDLVVKEGNASRLAALRNLVNDIEEKAERRAKQLRSAKD